MLTALRIPIFIFSPPWPFRATDPNQITARVCSHVSEEGFAHLHLLYQKPSGMGKVNRVDPCPAAVPACQRVKRRTARHRSKLICPTTRPCPGMLLSEPGYETTSLRSSVES